MKCAWKHMPSRLSMPQKQPHPCCKFHWTIKTQGLNMLGMMYTNGVHISYKCSLCYFAHIIFLTYIFWRHHTAVTKEFTLYIITKCPFNKNYTIQVYFTTSYQLLFTASFRERLPALVHTPFEVFTCDQ